MDLHDFFLELDERVARCASYLLSGSRHCKAVVQVIKELMGMLGPDDAAKQLIKYVEIVMWGLLFWDGPRKG